MNRILSHRSGSALIFLLAALTVVGIMVQTLVRGQSAGASVAAAKELAAMAEATALSGVELVHGIGDDDETKQKGRAFLSDRERNLAPGTPYGFVSLFGLPEDLTVLQYTPPMAYPPLTDLALEYDPRNNPPAVQGNDIRLPLYNAGSFLANTYDSIAGTSPAAILPSSDCYPLVGDSDYTGSGVQKNPPYCAIKSLEPPPGSTSPVLAWWGPKNAGPDLPKDAAYQGGSTSSKMPPPSLILVRDVAAAAGQTLRCYHYLWWVVSPSTASVHYYVTSGRIRRVYSGGAGEQLGSEEMVSATQLR